MHSRGHEARAHSRWGLALGCLVLVAAIGVGVRSAHARDARIAMQAGTPTAAVPPPVTAPPAATTAAAPGAEILGAGTLRTINLPVTDLGPGGTRSVVIYTPDVADPNALPVLYMLHGLPGEPTDLCNATTANELDATFRTGTQPFIMACPEGSSNAVADDEWANSVDGKTILETFVTDEARTAVEGTYPRPASMRAIGGFSMGGFGAASLDLRHPTLYSQVAVLAGYFTLDDPDAVFGTTGATQNAHDPTNLVGSAAGQTWFLDEALGDQLPLTAHASEQFAPSLRQAGATVTLVSTAGDHSEVWADAQLPAVARALSAGWGQP